ncbi:MAG: ATP-binding protein [Burkholderiaceae bacterium]|nr:ATP-binding protein [Burkholderiaceae bacterium]
MFKLIEITNYKSIQKIKIPLGRVNIFVGENGAGKSNILEAIALAGAANAGKLDNEFLASRGIRVTQPQLMRPAFSGFLDSDPIKITVSDEAHLPKNYELNNDNAPYTQWRCTVKDQEEVTLDLDDLLKIFLDLREAASTAKENNKAIENLDEKIKAASSIFEKIVSGSASAAAQKNRSDNLDLLSVKKIKDEKISIPLQIKQSERNFFTKYRWTDDFSREDSYKALNNFVIYSPENSALRMFEKEGQIEPLGINGEGLLKLLSVLSESNEKGTLNEVKNSLKLLNWFKNFEIVAEQGGIPRRMEIEDRYLAEKKKYFDQKSANEGFLFLVFYFCLFASRLTPKFFAVDNVDVSLNPKLCQRLIEELVKLAKKNDKQVLLTTHNPAILDGLNLEDGDQRLFVVSRGTQGETKIKRIEKPKTIEGAPPVRLSEAFLRGALGGLPKGF